MILTNNPKVYEAYKNLLNVEFFLELSQEDILVKGRDYVQLGAKLLMHPMLGRIRPNETPYKSLLLEVGGEKTDINSVLIIEDSIKMTKKSINNTAYRKYDDLLLEELQYLDKELFDSGMLKEREL